MAEWKLAHCVGVYVQGRSYVGAAGNAQLTPPKDVGGMARRLRQQNKTELGEKIESGGKDGNAVTPRKETDNPDRLMRNPVIPHAPEGLGGFDFAMGGAGRGNCFTRQTHVMMRGP